MSSLGLHIGLGASRVLAGNVGGVEDRWEFFITGEACEEMNRAEKDAHNMEIVFSRAVGDWIRAFEGVRDQPRFISTSQGQPIIRPSAGAAASEKLMVLTLINNLSARR